MKKIPLFLLPAIFLCSIASYSYALEVGTHKAINEYVAQHTVNGFSLDAYLKNQCGIPGGIYEELNASSSLTDSRKVWEWLRDGGLYEDKPPWTVSYTRSLNHFHNPLKTWDIAGFKGTFQSSVIWAQDQGAFGSLWGGDFSWKKDREYFYTALTGKDFSGNMIAPTQSGKGKYFANTFRGIGQVMHLVEDASVPAHTRNDAHVVGYHYELAVDKFRQKGDPVFTNAVASPINFDPSILSLSKNALAPIPIARIFDTDKYDPTNLDPNVTVGGAIGLSEYSNANFVSEGLLSANFQDFPFPRIQDTTIIGETIISPSGTYTRQYYFKNCCGETNGGQGYLLSTVDLLDYWRQKHPILSAGLPKIPGLDDNVYKDYTRLLIPRAVGYSAALLNYFFRGSMAISLPNTGVYAETTPDQGFTRLSLLAQNTTSTGEIMDNGTIELVVIYRLAYDDPFKNYPPSYNFQAAPEYTYIVVPEANGVRSIPRDNPAELTFDLSSNRIPLYAIDVNLQLVYHGRLGNEDGAVVVGLKDISEPTPVDILNDMDITCLNGSFYTAGSPEAIAQVDSNQDGIPEWDIYAHNLENVYLKISSTGNPAYASPSVYDFMIPNLNAGLFARAFYILSNNAFDYSFYQSWTNVDPGDRWIPQPVPAGLYAGGGITNQTYYVDDAAMCAPLSAPCYIWLYPTFTSYRGRDMWGASGIIYYNNAYPAGSECSCYGGILRTCQQQSITAQSAHSYSNPKGNQADVNKGHKSGNIIRRSMQPTGGAAGRSGF
ncbi:MAG: hypothetical protein M0Z67_08790 [Nitrospiraceae bacterium]|nr:hypothetical protein [Nitrospiraceae bacterium]